MMRNMYSPHFEEIIECGDGTEAVTTFNDSNPDWVVMDIKMKTMDGIEATKKIISSHPNAKVIIVSQFNDTSTIDTAINAGAVEFVNKENLSRVIDVINTKNQRGKK